MNPYKYRWYLATQDIPELLFGKDSTPNFKPKNRLQQYYDSQWVSPHNLYEAYQHPLGGMFVDIALGITMPAAVIGRRAKKVIELTRYFSEILDDD